MRRATLFAAIAGLAGFAAGCAGGSAPGLNSGLPPPLTAITIARGPCFGFCPVYDVTVSSDGEVSFDGKRHTQVIGQRTRRVSPSTYNALARSLAAFRPTGGQEVAVPCAAAVSDTPTYLITWRTTTGTAAVRHQAGCPAGPGKALDQVLGTVPDRLGIEAWARQVTRPGTGRG